ncbi:Glutamate synthase [NADPH] small chain [Prochlorococcus marinus str. MIT 1313]|nr:Glutamate synthase [NADPH] small chain [Prochlorococcus marinus str. MIT 1313]KZR72988.1 Glutamate synthase [NADPH] small chain [Prochlorococcus marinus str. MIT 1318]
MHVLDRDILLPSYDVLVVGAGIGGLTAAALLAKRGYRVLVVEQHYLPGGCASIFRRQGFTFDVGASLFFGFGEKGYNPHQFVMNELEEDITLVPMDETFTIHLDQQTKVSMYTQRERFWAEMCSCFPHQSAEIKALLSEFESFYHESLDSYGGQFFAPAETPPQHGINLMFTRPFYLGRLLNYLLSTQEQLFRRFTRDPQILKLFTLLNQNMTTCGLDQTPAIAGPMIHVESYTGGCYYAQGSPQMLANKLEKAIHKYGGQILYRNRIDEILIEKGKAVGCQLQSGLKIKAHTVISNTTIWNLYGKLIDPQCISRRKRKWAKKFRPSYSVFGVYLGVKAEAVPQTMKPTQILPYGVDGSSSYLTVYVTSMLDPEASPPGTHTLCIFLPEATPEITQPTDGKDNYHTRTYRDQKQKKASAIIDYLEKNYFPELRKHILVQEIATPQTIQRYTLKSHGSIGGPQVNMSQSYMSRLAARSDWQGLYCVGDSTSQGIGVVSVTVSAISAVNAILKDLRQPQYLPLKHYPKNYVHFAKASLAQEQHSADLIPDHQMIKTVEVEPRACLSPRCVRAGPDNTHQAHIARLVEAGNWLGAAQSLRAINPLSEITSYLSHSDDFCAPSCSQSLCPDASIPIKSLNRYVCEKVPNYTPEVAPDNGKRISIVGAGAAGLTCAHYLAQLGYQVDIYEKNSASAGMLSWVTLTSRTPYSVLTREIENLLLPSIHIYFDQALGEHITIAQLKLQYHAIFLACGLGEKRVQPNDIDHAFNLIHGLMFLEEFTHEPAIVRDKTLTIVGATYLATDIARLAIQNGASKVYLVDEQAQLQSIAQAKRLKEMKALGIQIHSRIDSIALSQLCSSSHQVIMAGFEQQRIESQLRDHLSTSLMVDIDALVDLETLQVHGQFNVFAGGDIIRGSSSIQEAIKDGRKAAIGINHALIKNHS